MISSATFANLFVSRSLQIMQICNGDFSLLSTPPRLRNKHEKFEGKGEASFDIPFIIQSHAESMKKIVGAN